MVEPIVLGVGVFETPNECCCCQCCAHDIPETIAHTMNGNLYCDDDDDRRYLAVSVGIFSIVRIVRPAQLLVSASEYVIPDKECLSPLNDDPCSVFRSMAFPISEFTCGTSTIAPHPHEKGSGGKCGC